MAIRYTEMLIENIGGNGVDAIIARREDGSMYVRLRDDDYSIYLDFEDVEELLKEMKTLRKSRN